MALSSHSDGRVVPGPWAHRGGKVHKGFYHALQAVWRDGREMLPKRLANCGQQASFHGLSLDSVEQAFRRRFERILHRGIENVSDHDMHKCYPARLEAPLPV